MILPGSDVARLFDVDELLRTLRSGFLAQARAPARGLRVRADLPGEGTATALLPGLLAGIPAYTVKVNAKFPDAVPALRGVVCLHDLNEGSLLAVLDAASLTAWRTGLAAALATDVLAAPGAATLGVVGPGPRRRGLGRARPGARPPRHVRRRARRQGPGPRRPRRAHRVRAGRPALAGSRRCLDCLSGGDRPRPRPDRGPAGVMAPLPSRVPGPAPPRRNHPPKSSLRHPVGRDTG